MVKSLTPIARAFAVCGMCAFMLGSGCSEEPARSTAVPAKPDLLLRVLQAVFDDGWTTAGEIVVTRDGRYQHTIHSLDHARPASETVKGQLPLAMMRALEQEVLLEEEFELVEGIATYEYGIDDHRVRHPTGIEQLLAFVADKQANLSDSDSSEKAEP